MPAGRKSELSTGLLDGAGSPGGAPSAEAAAAGDIERLTEQCRFALEQFGADDARYAQTRVRLQQAVEHYNSVNPTSAKGGAGDKVSTYFWVCIVTSAIAPFVMGFSIGYSSPTMAADIPGQLETQCYLKDGSTDGGGLAPRNPDNEGMLNCDLRLSDDMKGWFGSMINIGALLGALLGGRFVDTVGKKNGMVTSFCVFIVGWLFIAFAPEPEDVTEVDQQNVCAMLIASRLIIGFAIGIVCCSVANYQTEIAPTEIRGAVGTMYQLAGTVGLLAAYAVGTLLRSWRVLSYIMVGFSVIGGVISWFVLVETPSYFMLKGDRAAAIDAQRRLRDADSDIVGAVEALAKGDEGSGGGSGGGFRALCHGTAPKALAIGVSSLRILSVCLRFPICRCL